MLSISVNIAGRAYRLSVESEKEEENIRKAAAEINERIKLYSENYSFKDYQDLLAMVGLEIATKKISEQSITSGQRAELIKSLNDIDNLMQ